MSGDPGSAPPATTPRILLVSTRGLHPDVSRCLTFEFEDAIISMDDVDLVAPTWADRSRTLTSKVLKTVGPWVGVNAQLVPRATESVAYEPRAYDLSLVVVQTVRDLRAFAHLESWRGTSKTSICLVEELWVKNITSADIALLNRFDQVILNCHHSVEPLADRIRVPVAYLPPSVDMLRFCPEDLERARPIDAFSLGRRSSQAHRLLLERSRSSDFFYLYDSTRFAGVLDPAEHRELLAQKIHRAKWFPVSRAKVDEPGLTTTQAEIGFRYFEGAAGGAVMLGERPQSPSFAECFGWDDAVIAPAPGESILDVIDALSEDPDRVKAIRRRNVVESLRRHDSSARYLEILKLARVTPSQCLEDRREALLDRARKLESNASIPL